MLETSSPSGTDSMQWLPLSSSYIESLNFKTRPHTDSHPPAIWSISLSSLIVFQLSASASNAQSEHQSNALLMRGRTQMRQKVAENIPEKSQALGPLVWWTERIWHMLLGPLGASARVQLFASFHGERRERGARRLCQLGGDEAALPGMLWGRCEGHLLLKESAAPANSTQIEAAWQTYSSAVEVMRGWHAFNCPLEICVARFTKFLG